MKTLSFKVGLLVLVMAVSCTDTEIPKESQKISKEDIEKTLVEMGFDKGEITYYDDIASGKGESGALQFKDFAEFLGSDLLKKSLYLKPERDFFEVLDRLDRTMLEGLEQQDQKKIDIGFEFNSKMIEVDEKYGIREITSENGIPMWDYRPLGYYKEIAAHADKYFGELKKDDVRQLQVHLSEIEEVVGSKGK